MNLVYGEFIDFLENKGLEYDLQEGYYWLDRMIIRAFDRQGNEHKIIRIYVDDDFNITFKKYKIEDFEIEKWEDTAERYRDRLLKLESQSMETIKCLLGKYDNHKPYICHSGGKDSTVLCNIVRQADSNIPILFNNTSNESIDTYNFIRSYDNVRMLHPKEGFWQYLKRENFIPSRLARSCCSLYKHNLTSENLDHDRNYLLFMGMRNQESNNRKNYQTEHQFDYYPKKWMCGLPIRQWTELDIWLYIIMRNLPINNIYKYGYARCGCLVCPYRNDLEEIITRYHFPKQIERFARVQKSYFFEHERWIGLNCTLDEFMNKGAWKGGQYREDPTDEVITEFAEYKRIRKDVAEQFFNKKCCKCGRNIRQKDIIAMNLKFLGRQTSKFHCKKHLQELLNISNEQWNKYLEEFKSQGCELF